MQRDPALLKDIQQACVLILDFISDMTQEEFLLDVKSQSAVLHQLLVIGEVAKKISPGTRSKGAKIPWQMMAGMRDKLIHDYQDVDLEEVWKTASKDIPKLLSALDELIS